MKSIYFIAFAIASVTAHVANAHVTVEQAWVRATAPGQTVAGAYMKLKSSVASALVGVRTPVSKDAEIHEMSMDNGVMKMRAIRRITLPAGKTVELKSGGYHLMLMNIARPLRKGDTVPITLVIEGPGRKEERLEIKAEVRDAAPKADGHEQMRQTR